MTMPDRRPRSVIGSIACPPRIHVPVTFHFAPATNAPVTLRKTIDLVYGKDRRGVPALLAITAADAGQ